MLKVYPFASGSEVTASHAVTASYAVSASSAGYVFTTELAEQVLYPESGSPAAVNLCLITYPQYLELVNSPGVSFEQCIF
jgi:hypothetical protein